MVSPLSQGIQIDHLWYSSLSVTLDPDGDAVQQKDRLLGHRGSYPRALHC
jgi:hypothetical protein